MKAKFLFAAVFACAVFTAEAFDNYAQAFQAANKARNAKKFDESLKILEEAKSLAQKQGEKIQALNIAADICCWQKNDLKGALAKLDEILSLEGITPYQKTIIMVKKANFLKWRGKKADAEKVYKEAMELGAAGAAKQDLLNSYADLLRMNRKYDEAKKLHQDAIAVEKGAPYHVQNAKLGIARATAEQKQFDKALELYTEVTQIPKVHKWLQIVAYREIVERVYFPQKKFAEANEAIAKMEADDTIQKNQKENWIGTWRIRVATAQARDLMRQKKLNEAEEILKAAHGSKSNIVWVNQQLADAEADIEIMRGDDLKRQKKFDEAIETYKKAMETKGISVYKRHSALLRIAEALMVQKKFEEAKEFIDKSMSLPNLSPNQKIFSLNYVANYNLTKQNVDEAIKAMEKALTLKGNIDPNWRAFAYTKLADIYFSRKKDLAKAEEYMKKAMAVPRATWGKNKNLEKRIKDALAKQNQ